VKLFRPRKVLKISVQHFISWQEAVEDAVIILHLQLQKHKISSDKKLSVLTIGAISVEVISYHSKYLGVRVIVKHLKAIIVEGVVDIVDG
jgi:hypothetical protein